MPIFIFGCDSCNEKWDELFVKSTDVPPEKCPSCGAPGPKKRSTTAGTRFAASEGFGGWERNAQGGLQRVVEGGNSTKYGEGSV
jgi:putative FmdB family regulatory protein